MSNKTFVYLITGFLGAGKTTFLNRVIKKFPKDKKLTILMNEFGEIGIDGKLVEGDDIDMLEISRGSIFCVCVKTDFIKGLYELAQKIQPDVLLIESTGVANPSDLKRDLKLPIFKDRYDLKEQFCVIDAAHFLDALGSYTALDKQIASSTVFIINKVDLVDSETIRKIKNEIKRLHPSPIFHEAVYCDFPFEKYFMWEAEPTSPMAKRMELPELSEEDFESIVEEVLTQQAGELTPPDPVMSFAYKADKPVRKQIEEFTRALPKGILRAKGFFEEAGKVYLFNYVMGDWEIREYQHQKDKELHLGTIVLISRPELSTDIEEAASKAGFSLLGAVIPYQRAMEAKAHGGSGI